MAKTEKPKLEISPGESAQVKLLRAPYRGTNAFGTYVLVNLLHEGTEKVLFGNGDIQEALNEAGVTAGAEFILSRVSNSKQGVTKWAVEAVHASEGLTDDEFKRIMRQSLIDAIELTKGLNWDSESVRSICSGLFIARAR